MDVSSVDMTRFGSDLLVDNCVCILVKLFLQTAAVDDAEDIR